MLGVGTLTTGALTLQTGSTFNALLASNSSYSMLATNNAVALGGAAFSISLTTGATFVTTPGQNVIQPISLVTGQFTNTSVTTGGYTFTADYTTDAGSFDLDVTTAAVPEPSTWMGILTLAGLFGGAYHRRVRARVG